MRYEEALEKHAPLDEYERGWVEGIRAYSWMKDGTTYVGTTGRTLGDAIDKFLTERRPTFVADPKFPHHIEGCICPRFHDIAPNLLADLTCPVHGVEGSDPGDVLEHKEED